ncbi:MAG: transcriptional regulator [Kiritimatiellae bacterium]|nr:transcriptional regulator [Kiritimatiellia bacterium]
MTANSHKPYEALERVFHEPHRLAIMSALCAAAEGLTFNELKRDCGLTDGNLSRHLKALSDAGAIQVDKSFVGSRPCTTVYLRQKGRAAFSEYLEALEAVLRRAAESVAAEAGPVALEHKAETVH